MKAKHRVFISYHHDNDEWAKRYLIGLNNQYGIFEDRSVDTGDIDDRLLTDQVIREKIRDSYLRDSTVTILLVGTETKHRKHIDWEIHSSMYDGKVNKRSGILVVQLPSTNPDCVFAAYGDREKAEIYPFPNWSWVPVTGRSEFERRHPYLPSRVIDNLVKEDVQISVTRWTDVFSSTDNPYSDQSGAQKLVFLIDLAFGSRESCPYDLSRPMRR